MDTSTITACANIFKYLFSRNLESIGSKNDVLIVPYKEILKIYRGFKVAKRKKFFSIALLGGNGGKAKNLADFNLIIPSKITAKYKNVIFLGHLIFEAVGSVHKKNLDNMII